jgi:hypothetical protein
VTTKRGFDFKPAGRVAGSALLFLIVPVVFFIAVAQLTRAKGPQWVAFSFENPYAYLMNSLLLVNGRAPWAIEHPGTTTQVFGATVLRLSSNKSADDLTASVLQNPERHIRILYRALLTFTALILWLIPWITANALRNVVVGLLIQIPCLFYRVLLYYGTLFGSDLMVVPFSVIAICCCTLLVAPNSYPQSLQILLGITDRSTNFGSTRSTAIPLIATIAGLVCAFGMVTKLDFFPLVLVSLVCCHRRRNLVAFVVAFLLGLLFALVPIYSQLPRVVTWIFGLVIHSEVYGSGPVGLPSPVVYFSSLRALLDSAPLLLIIPVVTVLLLTIASFIPAQPRLVRPVSLRLVWTVFVVQLISLLTVAKHPAEHYLIPLGITTGLNLVLVLFAFQSGEQSAVRRGISWLALASLLAVGLTNFVQETPDLYAYLREQTADHLRLYRHAKEIAINNQRVDYFFSDSPEYALCYGNNYAGNAFGQQLSNLYPGRLFFNIFNSRFETFTDYIEPKVELQKYDHLYFLGTKGHLPTLDGLDPATFETIDHAGEIYLEKWTRP